MGIDTTRCAKEEDFAYEEEAAAVGRKGIEGCHIIKQVLCVWECQEGALLMSVLCAR